MSATRHEWLSKLNRSTPGIQGKVSVCVCVCERECVCVFVRERVCVCERERACVCV